MDFITEAFDSRISNSKTGDKRTFLQAKVEYLYYFLLGYLWNLNKESMTQRELTNFVDSLHGKLTLGSIVKSLKDLDKQKATVDFVVENMLIKYNTYRNNYIGHGYIFGDKEAEAEKILDEFYNDLVSAVPLLSSKLDIVVVTDHINGDYEGRVYHPEGNGNFAICQISDEILNIKDNELPQIFYRKGSDEYYKISPFVMIKGEYNPDIFVFNKIKDKSSGFTTYTQFFKTDKKDLFVADFKDISVEYDFNRISSNGTRVNLFELNHKRDQYFDVGILQEVYDFTVNKKSHVSVILWGNGGVGKTACAQELCERLLSESVARFSYVVFVSAKNRKFNEVTGKIEALNNICTFYDVIATVYGTIKQEKLVCKEDSEDFQKAIDEILSIQPCKNGRALLLVVDDFETFADEEKRKITEFINEMDSSLHKVLITTRNKKLAEGHPIPANKLDKSQTVEFVLNKMKSDKNCDRRVLQNFETWIKKEGAEETLIGVTDGVPLFVLQWINLFKAGYADDILMQNLSLKENAVDFLSGKVYEFLNDKARIIYIAIPTIVDKSKLNFHKDRLRAVCSGLIKDDDIFEDAFVELTEMFIIQSVNDSETIFSVYSEGFLEEMRQRFNEANNTIRNSISQRFANSGQNENLSLYESLIKEADNSQVLGNRNATIQKYEKIIKSPDAPEKERKTALINLFKYLIYQDDTASALNMFYCYRKEFADDSDVLYQLLFNLWTCDKELTIKEIEKYFDSGIVIDDNNLRTYALASAYFIKHYKSSYENKNVFDVGKKVYDFVSAKIKSNPDTAKKAIHEISMVLGQLLDFLDSSDEHKALATEVGTFIVSYSKTATDVYKAKRILSKIKTDSEEPTDWFVPEYIKYNDISGVPQYLNGTVNGIKGGIPWYDFEKFGIGELNKYGGTHAIMEELCARKKAIPVSITSQNEKGFYSLSYYDTNRSLSEIVEVDIDKFLEDAHTLESTDDHIEGVCRVIKNDRGIKRWSITGDNQEVYHITKSELKNVTDGLQDGDRVVFEEGVNTNPNAGDKAQIAINIRKI